MCSAVVGEASRERDVTSSNPTGRVSHEFCAKNTATCRKKNLFFSGFFRFQLCQVSGTPTLGKAALPSARQKALGKAALPIDFLPSAALGKGFAKCI
jgi:hypothetical protein